MKRKFVLSSVVVMLLLAVSVSAWWLIGRQEVMTCTDSDGGLDFYNTGSVFGWTLNQTFYNVSDYCYNDNIVLEYGCHINGTMNTTYAFQAAERCSTLGENYTCVAGSCVLI